jgi:NRAMP (natural resistance-associated macrophage protein)-like metal ion transporter
MCRLSTYVAALGPGLMAGLADNDPAGVATYAISGAVAGYRQLWLLVLATFMVQAVQVSAARLGGVAQRGILGVTRTRYGWAVALLVAVVVLISCEATLIADVAGLGAALQLLTGINWRWFVLPVSVLLLLMTVLCNFAWIRRFFIALGLLLLSFVVTAFLAHPNWHDVARGTLVPTLPASQAELAAMVAVLGTTVSPYLVVWQAEGEVEARRTRRQFNLATMDVTIGYIASNLVSYFIVVTAGATIYANGLSITTAVDVANALRPFAGNLASTVFGFGLLGAGLLAVPMFPISIGFVASEIFGWHGRLSRPLHEAPRFYAVVALAFLSGSVAVLLGVDPIVALFDSQVLNGLLMPVLIVILALLVNDRRVMGTHRSTPYYNVWLAISFVVIGAASVALLAGLV